MWSVSQVLSHSSNASGGHSSEVKFHLIDVAPAPVFAWLVRFDDGVFGGVEVFRGVLILGRIAATDVAADHAQPQVNPSIAVFQAFFTAAGFWCYVSNLAGVRAVFHFCLL
jgi:hypothetical protein